MWTPNLQSLSDLGCFSLENLFLEKHFGLLYFVFAFIGVESTDTIELSIASNFISSFTCDFIISFSKLLSIS